MILFLLGLIAVTLLCVFMKLIRISNDLTVFAKAYLNKLSAQEQVELVREFTSLRR